MQRIWLCLIALACCSAAVAQTGNDYHKWEVYGGYSHSRMTANSGEQTAVELPDVFSFQPCTAEGADTLGPNLQRLYCTRRGFHGFDASATFNFSRYVGIKGNVTGHFKSDRFVDHFPVPGGTRTDTNNTRERAWQFLVGLQFKDNSDNRHFKPFGHVLAGAARQTVDDVQTSTGGLNFHLNDKVTSFAMKVGGGIDIRATRHIDVRVLEVDLNPIVGRDRFVPGNADFELTLHGRKAFNYAFSFGVVLH